APAARPGASPGLLAAPRRGATEQCLHPARPATGPLAADQPGGHGPDGPGGVVRPGQPVLPRGQRTGLAVRARRVRKPGGGSMSWPGRLPRDLPWASPYPLPRDTSDALLAEGRCENFSLLMDRYLAFGDNRGQLQLLRELTDRKALVPDFQGQRELIAACDA